MTRYQYGIPGPENGGNRPLVLRPKRATTSPIGNNHPNPVDDLREQIIGLIKAAEGIAEEELISDAEFVRSAPDSVVRDLHGRMMSNVDRAKKITWEAKLEEYIQAKPPKYETHKHDFADPSDFLRKVWGDYIKHGVLYQDTLSHYDNKIIPAVYRYWQLHGRPLNDRLPPPRQKRTDTILQQVSDGPWSAEEIRRAIRALDRRDQRSKLK
jgi:hypothetical protein